MSLDAIAPDVDIEKELAAEAETTPVVEEEKPVEEKVEKPEEKKESMVPHGALHEERMKRKEAQARAEQLERESAERFKKLEERLQKLANPEKPVPSFQEDPANHLKHEVETLKPVTQEVADLRKQFQDRTASEEMARVTSAAESEFLTTQPDYFEAVSYLKSVADRNLQVMGVDDPAMRMQAVNEQAANLARRAIETGKNPAQVAYEMAKNYGYQSKKKEPDLNKKIETLEKGQKATPSMPSGGKKETALSLAALEQMSDEDFNKILDDDAQWRKLISQ